MLRAYRQLDSMVAFAGYHPANHFWQLQGIETALGGVALALIGFAAWWTHERAA